MATIRRTMTVFGSKLHVILKPTESGYSCEMDAFRERADMRDDIAGAKGFGGDIPSAMGAFVASCHRRERMPLGSLCEID